MNEATELKQRIMSRIPSIKRQTTECLRAAMSNDIFVYLPTPAASHALFKEWTKLFDQEYLGNIAVVTGDIEQLRKRESNDLGDSLMVFSRGHKRLFAFTYEEFLALEDKIAIQDYNSPGFISSVVFEGFEDISKFEKMIDRLRGPLRKILFKIALTNLPSTFYNYYYSSKNRYFECFLPIWSQDGFSFYKKLYDGCKIVSYASYESDVPAISLISVIQESNFENQQQILNLIKRNIFDYNHAKNILKMSTKFISNKLIGLFNILKQRSGQNNYIYFSSESDMKTVYEIVCGRCDIKDPLEQSKQESCNIYLIRNGVLKGTDIVFNAKFITDIPSISRHDENIAIIFFNFAPFIHRCPRFYLLSSREIEEFKKNIIFDEKIIKEIKPALKINIKESNKSIPVNFMVLSNDIKYCQDKLRGKYSTKSIELQGNYVNVSAYSKSYFTAIDLSNILKFPVVFPKTPYKSYIDTYICQRLIFGTLSTLNSFVDPFEIRCNGFLTFISKGFIVYAFSNRINLRVEVQQEDIETYVFMDVQKQERSTDRSYVSLLFALRRYPKIFTCDRDGLIGKYVKDTIPAGEKLMFFETLQWRRASIVEVPFVSERYDLKISLPFHQPIKGEQSYEYKPNIDRISNIAASRINDDVAQDYMFTNQNDKFSSKNIIDDSDKLCGDVGENMYKSNCKDQYNDEYDNNDMQYNNGNEKMYSRGPRAASDTYTNDDGYEKVYSRSPQAAVDMYNNDNKHFNDGNEKVYSRSGKVKKDFYANENISNDAVNVKDDQSTDTADSRRKKHSFCLIEALLNSLHQIQTRVVAASVPHISSPKLPLKKVLQYFMESPFDDFYSIACLISKKGRLLVNKICPKDLEYISSLDIPSFCRAFESSLKWRFEPVNIRMQFTPFERPQGTLIRSVTITPLSIVYHFEAPSESNRVLRRFDPDKFIRIAIREENDRHKFSSDSTKNEDAVYDYFRSTMINGLPIGLRRYFFLIMTTSQLKTHNAWFVTPHESNGVLIGADYIKMWLGEFQDIKNIGKYAVRVGQALSSTTPTLEFNSFLQVPDIERNNYNFTDGVGILSYSNAQKLSKSLGLLTVPSAFQIRFAGYKGVIAVHPFVDNKAKFKEWLKRNVKANSSDFVLVNDDKRVGDQPTVVNERLNYTGPQKK